jgi:hypothetical protein
MAMHAISKKRRKTKPSEPVLDALDKLFEPLRQAARMNPEMSLQEFFSGKKPRKKRKK